MTRGRIRAKLGLSNLYSYSCLRPQTKDSDGGPHSLQGPGFSRVVFCNQSRLHRRAPLKYVSNYISTTKYNILTFLPKAIFEQFRRVANLYFLMAACFSLTSVAPFSPVSMIAPLAFVVGLSMAKEALEDWRRFMQDMKVNSRKVSVHKGDGEFGYKHWQHIQVGDVVKVEKDQFFPADLLLLSSSYEDGICYVETMNLDGETNLKIKRALEATLHLDEDGSFAGFTGTVRCEDPNPSLYTFIGNLEYDHQTYALDPSQILLRDSKLRNTPFVFGVVIFTGHESKVMQNSTKSPSKRSTIERKMDYIIYFLFTLLVVISFISSIGFAVNTKFHMPDWWYMRPQQTTKYYNPSKATVSGIYHLVTALILYGYLIPISLYVSIEVVKVMQASFINQDLHMTSNLNEELGQVDTILTDKTGTLTCNQMDFLKCSIAGVSYGVRSSEVEIAAAKQMASDVNGRASDYQGPVINGRASDVCGKKRSDQEEPEIQLESVITSKDRKEEKPVIKGFSFEDDRLMNGNWLKESQANLIALFFRILAVCHTAIPELNEDTGEFGFELCRRTQSSVFVQERYPSYGSPVEREYKILNLMEFNSKRKRMSVIVCGMRMDNFFSLQRCRQVIIFDRLSVNGRHYQHKTSGHLNLYGECGLRTLALAYKKLDESEYHDWNSKFQKAKTTVGADREAMLENVSDMMEKDLILVGATAVEDKLQKGVPQCIDKLAQAGLKIWVLTGDKMETAINIGFACNLLRESMKQICITINTDLSAEGDKKVIGKTLSYALEEDMKRLFLSLAVECASVICCRVSPKQKALVTRLVKEGSGKTTLAIGDGANDVGMIQEADIGVGISGVEGMQAVMASDFSISQFRFLERLLVVHGHWCYKRIAQMFVYSLSILSKLHVNCIAGMLFLLQNIAFGLTLFYFEAFTGFSGQSVYDDWYMILFNVVLTSLPVISLGVFEQDVSSEVCLQFPALYQQGAKNLFFDWTRIFGWIGNGLYSSIIIFFVNLCIFYTQAFRDDGQTSDMTAVGTTMFTCIIWAVNFQIAFTMSHFTWIQHAFVWGSICTWYVFLILYGMSSTISDDAYQMLVEVLAPSPIFWYTTLVVTCMCNLPYLIYLAFERLVNPMDHHIIQEIKYYKKDVTDARMWTRERSKARQKTKIGFTATVDAKIRQLKGKLQKKYSTLSATNIAATSQ
ncbi:hypothetical protein MKW92_018131 [Papaver armeniacum]|nr:hypothetical protein MKW92_018131 [Papaver armeniacum]